MRVEMMSVAEHDLIFAMTSHLPHLVSYALIDSIRTSNLGVKDNSGGGLKEFLRPVSYTHLTLPTNREV